MRIVLLSIAALFVFAAPLTSAHIARGAEFEKPKSWAAYQNTKLGFTVYYPTGWFNPDPEPPEKDGRSFTSPDGKARIAAFGMLDPKWLGAELYDQKRILADGRADDALAIRIYKGDLREEGGAYEDVSEKRVEKNWLTITGKRGSDIYFEKFIFSCKDKVISVLAYTYPQAEEEKYGSILKTLLRRFGAGSGSETPRCL